MVPVPPLPPSTSTVGECCQREAFFAPVYLVVRARVCGHIAHVRRNHNIEDYSVEMLATLSNLVEEDSSYSYILYRYFYRCGSEQPYILCRKTPHKDA